MSILKLGEIISAEEYLNLERQGKTHKEILLFASELFSNKEVQTPTPKKQSTLKLFQDKVFNSDSTGAKIIRGLATSGGRVLAGADFLTEKIGFDLVDDKKVDNLLSRLDTKKEETSRENVSQERLQELQALDTQSQEAQSIWENVSAGASKMADVALHPSEWTTQGIVEGITDPLNFVSFGSGAIAAKVATNLFAKAAVGAVAGAVEGAVVNSASEYAIERGRGHSVEQATKVALQSGGGGAIAGSAFGSLGGAYNGLTTSNKHQNNSETLSSKDDILDNPLLKEEEPIQKEVNTGLHSEDMVMKTHVEDVIKDLVDDGLLSSDAVKKVQKEYETSSQVSTVTPVTPQQRNAMLVGSVIKEVKIKTLQNLSKTEELAVQYEQTKSQIMNDMLDAGAKPSQILQEINKVAPLEEEVRLTYIINDGKPIENRLSGMRIRESLSAAIAKPVVEASRFNEMLLNAGASENLAKVATSSYASKNMSIFDEFIHSKVVEASEADNQVTIDAINKKFNDIEVLSQQYRNTIDTRLQTLRKNPRYDELMEFVKDLESKDTLSPQRLEAPREIREENTGKGYELDVTPAQYSSNYAHGFLLTKAKVKRINEGRPTPEDLADIQNDLGIVEQSEYFNPPETVDEIEARVRRDFPEQYAEDMAEAEAMFGGDIDKDYATFQTTNNQDFKTSFEEKYDFSPAPNKEDAKSMTAFRQKDEAEYKSVTEFFDEDTINKYLPQESYKAKMKAFDKVVSMLSEEC